jgi:hypothetical protein
MVIGSDRFLHQWFVKLESIDDDILIVLFNDVDLSGKISLHEDMVRDSNVMGLQHLQKNEEE